MKISFKIWASISLVCVGNIFGQTAPVDITGLWVNPAGNLIQIKATNGVLEGSLIQVAPAIQPRFSVDEVVIKNVTSDATETSFDILFKAEKVPGVTNWARLTGVKLSSDRSKMEGDYPDFVFQMGVDANGNATAYADPWPGPPAHYVYRGVATARIYTLQQKIAQIETDFEGLESKLFAQVATETKGYNTARDDYAGKLDQVIAGLQAYATDEKAINASLQRFYSTCEKAEFDKTNAEIIKWGSKAAYMVAVPEGGVVEWLLGEKLGHTAEYVEKSSAAVGPAYSAAMTIKDLAAKQIGNTLADEIVTPIKEANLPKKEPSEFDDWNNLLRQGAPSDLIGPAGKPSLVKNAATVSAWLDVLKANAGELLAKSAEDKIVAARETFKRDNADRLKHMNQGMSSVEKLLSALAASARNDGQMLHPEQMDQLMRQKTTALNDDDQVLQAAFDEITADATPAEFQQLDTVRADWAKWLSDARGDVAFESKLETLFFAKEHALEVFLTSKAQDFDQASAAAQSAVVDGSNGYLEQAMPGTISFFGSLSDYVRSAQSDFLDCLSN